MHRQSLRPYFDHLILLLLVGTCYLLFFHDLGDIGLLGPDEPRYASVAREMYLTNDYVTPRLHGIPWFEKPPLMYWGAALGYAIFGINEWGARFPSALGASLCVLLLYFVARKLWDRTVGVLAALIMASSIGYFAFARAASMDMPLTVCLTLALGCFLLGYNAAGPQRRWWFYGFYAILGLGTLAKGPVALLLPGMSLFVFLLARRKLDEWKTWHPEGVLIALAVALPWYVACTWVNGYEFIEVFIVNQNLARFTSTIHGHERPIYFYLPVFILLTFPWTFLLIPALTRRWSATEQIIGWWVVVQFVFFSLAGSKLPGYILPIVPPVALLLARELRQPVGRTFKIALFIEAGAMAFIGIAFGFYGDMLNVDPHVDGRLITAVTFVLAIGLIVIAYLRRPVVLAVFNSASMMLLVLIATTLVFPRFDRTDTMRPWDAALQPIIPENQTVLLYKPDRWVEYGLQFYRYNNARSVHSPEELATAVAGPARVLCITDDTTLQELSRLGDVEMEIVQTIGRQTAFWAWQQH
jgi:4-amino-4-deoxy-L-arabinose transferase-like glycosyltransferase